MRRRPMLLALGSGLVPGAREAIAGAASARTATGSATTPASLSASPSSSSPATTSPDAQPALGVSHRALRFPADHGAHPDTHIEWWYATGWLRAASSAASTSTPSAADDAPRPDFGFQVTFFRTRTGLGEGSASRFAARQVVFAHVALTDLAAGGPALHDQRVAREGFGLAATPAPAGTQVLTLGDWSMTRAAAPARSPNAPGTLRIDTRADRFALALALQATQPVMLQGDAGFSQKGPLPQQASHYYSEPQLAVRGRVARAGRSAIDVVGRAWLDHEWSDAYVPPDAVGWDWVGFDLADGAALMAFRMRRADGGVVWAGGSFRAADGTQRSFAPGEVAFKPLRSWTSPRTHVAYPVEWLLDTPAGSFRVAALQDDQELDSRGSTGTLYWEGLCALRRADGRVAGWGYLELTGYADRLRL